MIDLKNILVKHQKWLNREPDGERANLTGVNLYGANLTGVNLYGADLTGAKLIRADLLGADLTGADFTRADLTGADFTRADLTGADLTGAKLIRADLSEAKLTRANLYGADLPRADLTGADLTGATNVPYIPMTCPDEGDYTAYKKVREDYIVVLHIPSDARRSSASGRKCRCDKAEVIGIEHFDGSVADVSTVYSNYDHDFSYTVGKTVTVDNFDNNRWNECAPGIHHFMNRQEAIEYVV